MEPPSDETMAAMRRLAGEVQDELLIAGLPSAGGLHPLVAQGVIVELDVLGDDDAAVSVHWRPHPSLANAAARAAAARDVSAGTMQRLGQVGTAMLPAIAGILSTAGFTLDTDEDIAAGAVRVLAAPDGGGTARLLED
ncbi:hypothetical protein OG552_21290 [Streptomyces sp. NBC_01476]|uniref:hypothetical protein n=1 Tax=Streptomyces sp. NBC_01476 TaxID=2903881 RepID=UPI002E327AA9|nr:hypothetical protein [Streptomyces sp. NBC_01476]